MARVYADARNGLLEPSDATRLVYILTCLQKSLQIDDSKFEPPRSVEEYTTAELIAILQDSGKVKSEAKTNADHALAIGQQET